MKWLLKGRIENIGVSTYFRVVDLANECAVEAVRRSSGISSRFHILKSIFHYRFEPVYKNQ